MARRVRKIRPKATWKRHGLYKSPTWYSWNNMRIRCYNRSHVAYPRYGGAGVTVCPQWVDFGTFLQDMGVRPEGKTLDRVNRTKPYGPDNCRWATAVEQQNNRSCGPGSVFLASNATKWTFKIDSQVYGKHYQRFPTKAEAEAFREQFITDVNLEEYD